MPGGERKSATSTAATAARRRYVLLEAAALAVYAWSATRPAAFNTLRPVSGLSILALLCWLIALWGVGGFLLSRGYVTEADRMSAEEKIRAGSLLHGLLMGTAAVLGVALLLTGGGFSLQDLPAAAGHLLAAAASLLVWRRQRRMRYRTDENNGGKPGRET